MKSFNKRFPFADAPETMCFTCSHVLNDEQPVLYISHDEDGCWQFLCGRCHTENEARIVSLVEMIEIDKSAAKFADLKCGEYAEADIETGEWHFGKKSN